MDTDRTTAPLRVAFKSIGCKLNQYEADALKFGFDNAGCRIVPFGDRADVYVINTCTVTGSGDSDSRKAVRRARRTNPEATVVATGCYAHRRPNELEEAGASLVVDNAGKSNLHERLSAHLGHQGRDLEIPPDAVSPSGFLQQRGAVDLGRTRGALQIQDGCDEHCTYCIIPGVRGPGRSRPIPEILDQAEAMAAAGYRELALTGVHTGSYGYDRQEPEALVSLLERMDAIEGLSRVRLNSVEPGYFSEALIEFAATSEKLCRHFHVPLQSGDDQVLRRMGRRYLRAEYRKLVETLAKRVPKCAIGADVMVGFPGESDRQFDGALAFIGDLPLTYLHVFSYSQRSGTAAERLTAHQPADTKKHRSRQLIRLGERKRLDFHQQHVGDEIEVLVEDENVNGTSLSSGLSDNYIKTLFAPSEPGVNRFDVVRIERAREDLVFGETALQSG
jgi:threonylcarbamoyladenosine tRNA methylthiotransferase MtaB